MSAKRDKEELESSRERLVKYRAINKSVGIRRIDVQLDETTIKQLEILVEKSGYQPKEKGGRSGVVTYAIDLLYKRCILEKPKKPSLKKRVQQKLIASNIVTWLFGEVPGSTDRKVLDALKGFPVPIDSELRWTRQLINDLSRVNRGEHEDIWYDE